MKVWTPAAKEQPFSAWEKNTVKKTRAETSTSSQVEENIQFVQKESH